MKLYMKGAYFKEKFPGFNNINYLNYNIIVFVLFRDVQRDCTIVEHFLKKRSVDPKKYGLYFQVTVVINKSRFMVIS